MKKLRRLSRILQDIETRGEDLENVVIDERAIHIIVPDEAEEPELELEPDQED